MGRPDRKRIFLAALGVLAVCSWIWGLTAPVGRRGGRPASGGTSAGVSIPAAAEGEGMSREHARTRHTDWGRNPFVLGEGLLQGAGGLTLSGIVWDPVQPVAMINDHMVAVGDSVDGRRVTRITERQVFLEEAGREFVLELDGAL